MSNLPTTTAPAAPLPINSTRDLEVLGKMLSDSNLFGTANASEGLAIVAMCHQKRISWMDFMQTFHMIKGRVTKKTDAMLADLHRIGGTHRLVSRTADRAEAVFRNGESEYTSTITWQDCLQEPFVYQGGKEEDIVNAIENGFKWPNGKPLQMKSKYRTPRARMQMLWARCVSDGVRAVAPECCQGVYTPEETSDFVELQMSSAAPAPTISRAQGVASPSPLSVDVCPGGPLMGRPWAEMDTKTLQLALSTPNPMITTEMQDHIRGILVMRENVNAAAADCVRAAVDAEERRANNIGSDIND